MISDIITTSKRTKENNDKQQCLKHHLHTVCFFSVPPKRSEAKPYLECLWSGTETAQGAHPFCVDQLWETCGLIKGSRRGGLRQGGCLPPILTEPFLLENVADDLVLLS